MTAGAGQPTPGPWSIERDGCSVTMGAQVVATAIAPDGATIGEQRANARLIAAAPEMLAALSRILAHAGQYMQCDACLRDISRTVHGAGCVYGDARALIARIEGREP